MASCSDPIDPEKHELIDEGILCVSGKHTDELWDGGPQALASDSEVYVQVHSVECLNNTCEFSTDQSCEVALQDGTLVVTSALKWERLPTRSCHGQCIRMYARCSGPALPAGTYPVRFGTLETQLEIPSTLTSSCFGE